MTTELVLLAALWLAYFALHSLLATLAFKRWLAARVPRLMPAYRLGYNALAVLLLLPPAWLMLAWDGPLLWAWEGVWAWLAHLLALVALGLFAWSLAGYDGGEFSGLRQWRGRHAGIEDRATLQLSTLHRFVRHPWYLSALLLIWSRDMDAARLLSALLATGYFALGSRLEERKLIAFHGEAYRRYRRRVPGLLPWPGRRLEPREARELEALARGDREPPAG
jgi:protein-S-isoprenylcysteine O-methyltransferase Ste14